MADDPKKQNNYAFIDSQNLNLSIRNLGWKLDFRRFRVYLTEKYGVSKAILFIGYVEGNNKLYKALQEFGYICIFKPTLIYKDGSAKGNCDAELVLYAAAIEYQNYNKAIIISGDGDFFCLADYLIKNDKLKALLVPDQAKFSGLLKMKHIKPYLRFVSDLKIKLGYVK